jgi:hypothetical protein
MCINKSVNASSELLHTCASHVPQFKQALLRAIHSYGCVSVVLANRALP